MATEIDKKGKRKMSKFGFNTPQPEKKEAPKLESSGLAGFEHEVKLKDGQTVKFVPLHGLSQCLSINVHRKQWNYDGLGFRPIPVGSKNSHLPFLNPPVMGSPFELDPDKEVKSYKTLRYMLVFVIDAPENYKAKGHVAYVELRDNYTRQDGSFNVLKGWQEDNDGESVENHVIAYTRNGSGARDTTYRTTVGKSYNLTDEQLAVVEREVEDVQNYILSLFDREWSLDEFRRIYNSTVVVERNAKHEDTQPELEHELVDDTEIPF